MGRPLLEQAGWSPLGLRVIDGVVSSFREAWTIEAMRRELDVQKVERIGGNRTLRVGFDYASPKKLCALPWWLLPLRGSVRAVTGVLERFDSATLRECGPGFSIAPHVDNPSFSETIVICNLGAACRVSLEHIDLGAKQVKKLEFRCKRRTAIVLTGEARYRCTHAISTAADAALRYSIVLRRKLLSGAVSDGREGHDGEGSGHE